MPYKISKTPIKSGYGGFPFGRLKVGESFIVRDITRVQTVRTWATYFSNDAKGAVKFSVRKVKGGHRCYRVK